MNQNNVITDIIVYAYIKERINKGLKVKFKPNDSVKEILINNIEDFLSSIKNAEKGAIISLLTPDILDVKIKLTKLDDNIWDFDSAKA